MGKVILSRPELVLTCVLESEMIKRLEMPGQGFSQVAKILCGSNRLLR